MGIKTAFVLVVCLGLVQGKDSKCKPVPDTSACSKYYHYAIETNDLHILNITNHIRNKHDTHILESFFCVSLQRPCGASGKKLGVKNGKVLACQKFCQVAWGMWKKYWRRKQIPKEFSWPQGLRCESLPTHQCLHRTEYDMWKYITKENKHKKKSNKIMLLEDNDTELKTMTLKRTKKIYSRRYDMWGLGHTKYFRGWADVQGQGAANDYCRVLGEGKRMFLTCSLAGSHGHKHEYVSQKGLDMGSENSWFMRDMNKDGRDDYCRCIGNTTVSHLSCMEAVKLGFMSSPRVGGSQYSFMIPNSEGCYGQTLNPFTGFAL